MKSLEPVQRDKAGLEYDKEIALSSPPISKVETPQIWAAPGSVSGCRRQPSALFQETNMAAFSLVTSDQDPKFLSMTDVDIDGLRAWRQNRGPGAAAASLRQGRIWLSTWCFSISFPHCSLLVLWTYHLSPSSHAVVPTDAISTCDPLASSREYLVVMDFLLCWEQGLPCLDGQTLPQWSPK